MLPFIALAAAAVAAGKLIYDVVKDDGPSSSSSQRPVAEPDPQEQARQRAAVRSHLIKEVRDDIHQDLQALLAAHGDIVRGDAPRPPRLADLRAVAELAPDLDGLAALQPLGEGLDHTPAYRTEARHIARLRREHEALRTLIQAL